MSKKLLVVVPLRRASVRVPEKIYADIRGISLAARTVGRVLEFAAGKSDVITCAAVDELKTQRHLNEIYPELIVLLTDPALSSGTDRVHAACRELLLQNKIKADELAAVVNLQGDMPFFSTEILAAARDYFAKNTNFEGVWTAGHAFDNVEEIQNPSCVKALRSHSGRAVYFSRYPIPYSRVEPSLDAAALCHIGIYAYAPRALEAFCATNPSVWERSEGLEQLRALDIDLPFVIDKVAVPAGSFSYRGIDTPEDLAWAQKFAP